MVAYGKLVGRTRDSIKHRNTRLEYKREAKATKTIGSRGRMLAQKTLSRNFRRTCLGEANAGTQQRMQHLVLWQKNRHDHDRHA
jgi:hypothetical protein